MHFVRISSVFLLAGIAIAAPVFKRANSTLPSIVKVNTRSEDQVLLTQLMTAPTQSERMKLLDQPGDFVFDFNPNGNAPSSAESKGKGGISIAATSKTFPALVGNGASMTVGFLGPCGMNTPHVHNRATELNFVAKGRLVTNFVEENGLKTIGNTLSTNQMAVFPQGAIHIEFNPDCEDTVFVAGFNNADPGVQSIAQSFFQLRPDIVQATLGSNPQSLSGSDIETFRELIPANIALGIDECLAKCNMKRNAKRDIHDLFR
ncbi:spherulin-1B precursor [Moelleriella libera RCEF 2490]|uniref:Spherulin-1B n=1 Tax=Moelleriella libera RCEF 2490 TaxID=1081109 RepID=A0A168AAI2_9HYPO|nr:spherulin-1B precursor [Moelleriella libera RCEF 2490]